MNVKKCHYFQSLNIRKLCEIYTCSIIYGRKKNSLFVIVYVMYMMTYWPTKNQTTIFDQFSVCARRRQGAKKAIPTSQTCVNRRYANQSYDHHYGITPNIRPLLVWILNKDSGGFKKYILKRSLTIYNHNHQPLRLKWQQQYFAFTKRLSTKLSSFCSAHIQACNLSNQTHKRKSHLFAEVLKPLPSTSFVTYRYWILPHTMYFFRGFSNYLSTYLV